jgi:hypothetical protein
MNSNRIWLFAPEASEKTKFAPRWQSPLQTIQKPINLQEIAAPVPIVKPQPGKIVRDLLIATLLRVQSTSSAEVAAAAVHYLELIRAEAE